MREPRTEGRVVRKSLLESERWLTLKDNADRLAFISILLNCDDYGNYSGEPYRLMRMWRDFGITTTALVAKTLSELQDHDLIGLYDAENRPFIHVQRLFNTKQWWWRSFPKSPFPEDKDNPLKQRVSDLSIKPDLRQHKPGVRGLGFGEVQKQKALPPKPLPAVAIIRPEDVNETVWHDFLIIRKAKKSPLTATALRGIQREATKAGVTLNNALAMACERGWQGFKAEWVSNAGQSNGVIW